MRKEPGSSRSPKEERKGQEHSTDPPFIKCKDFLYLVQERKKEESVSNRNPKAGVSAVDV